MSKKLTDYTVITQPDGKTFIAYAPAIESCYAVAYTPEEARSELDNVFAMIVEWYAERGEPLPEDIAADLVPVAR